MSDQESLPFTPLRSVEAWAEEKQTESHWLAAARYASRWGLGREVSEEVFDAAIASVQSIVLRS